MLLFHALDCLPAHSSSQMETQYAVRVGSSHSDAKQEQQEQQQQQEQEHRLQDIDPSATSVHDGVLQLKIGIILTMLKLSAWRRRATTPARLLVKFGHDMAAQEKELAEAVQQLVLSPAAYTEALLSGASCRASQGMALLEGYALKNLQGRLQPGCCNTSFTNLAGPSEAALPTKLCSRCRRVRYCSVSCQKAGWSQGQHDRMCKGV